MGKFGSNKKISKAFWPLNVSYKELFQVVNGNLIKNTWFSISLQIQWLKGKTILYKIPLPETFKNRFRCILPRMEGTGPPPRQQALVTTAAQTCGRESRTWVRTPSGGRSRCSRDKAHSWGSRHTGAWQPPSASLCLRLAAAWSRRLPSTSLDRQPSAGCESPRCDAHVCSFFWIKQNTVA